MFCTQCGTKIESGAANFCPQCGQETPESLGRRSRARKKLYRSRYNRTIAGVCAGFAEYIDADPTLIRLLAVCALLFSAGTAGLVYIFGWALMPEEPVMLRASAPQPQAS